jgi:hypothetical protein
MGSQTLTSRDGFRPAAIAVINMAKEPKVKWMDQGLREHPCRSRRLIPMSPIPAPSDSVLTVCDEEHLITNLRLRCLAVNRYKPIKTLRRKSVACGVGDVNLPTSLFQFARLIDSHSGTYANRHYILIGFPSVNGECHRSSANNWGVDVAINYVLNTILRCERFDAATRFRASGVDPLMSRGTAVMLFDFGGSAALV